MTTQRLNSFGARKALDISGKKYTYYSLQESSKKLGDLSRLPYSLKVLLENLLRYEDGVAVKAEDIQAIADWLITQTSNHEIAFNPARVLMQNFTGVPAVVDLAAMREAMKTMGSEWPLRDGG